MIYELEFIIKLRKIKKFYLKYYSIEVFGLVLVILLKLYNC